MLKIKDSVDLKELEKFGFKPKYDENTGRICAYQKKCEKDYETKTGILSVLEQGQFGDSTLVIRYRDRRNRGITLDEMLENIQEISNMTYKEFKEKILKKG